MINKSVEIDYTNWKGERFIRRIVPIRIFFGSNEWHTKPQWLIEANDLEKNAPRTFAMKDIHSWESLGAVGEHTSHCCVDHGCKYGDDECPVENGTDVQEYPCWLCDEHNEITNSSDQTR